MKTGKNKMAFMNSVRTPIIEKIFGLLFLLTGIFSIISSLYAWGEGWLFSISDLNSFLLPMADLLTTGPLSLITAYGILKGKDWYIKVGILTAGMFIYGSVLVLITLLCKGKPYPIQLIIPSTTGFVIAISFFIFVFKQK
jgi:hypothetical protein